MTNRKTPSGGKKAIVDPRQKQITMFFNVKSAEETGNLESSGRLNSESADARLSGAAAGVGAESEASQNHQN